MLLAQPAHHAIIRHALAPGTGDPFGEIDVNNCLTQRNLNDVGRAQARRLGERLKQAGVKPTRVISSIHCRCMDTAKLMNLGDVINEPNLNSVWTVDRETERERTQNMLTLLRDLDETDKLIMISHAVNISALTGRSPVSGEGYVIKVENGRIVVVAEIRD